MTLSKAIANIQRRIREGIATNETEVEIIIVEKHHGDVIMAEIGKHTILQLNKIFKIDIKKHKA